MRITKKQLQRIIKEELENVLSEGVPTCVPDDKCPNAGHVDLGRHPEFGWLGEACLCNKDDKKERQKAQDRVIMYRTNSQQKDWIA